jgi:hypothetical protein
MPTHSDESSATAQLPWELMHEPPAATAPAESAPVEPAPVEPAAAEDPPAAYDHLAPDAVDYASPVPAEPLEEDLGPAPRGGGWTVAMLCVGIGLIACCVIIPQADANRRLVYERERLKVDLDSIRKQVATNDEFLRRVADDPNLAERLAQRQMRIIREGTRVLELKKTGGAQAARGAVPEDVSPFHLVEVSPPPPMPPYQPRGGLIARLCYDPHRRLYLMGTGLMLMAAGLVFGFGPMKRSA